MKKFEIAQTPKTPHFLLDFEKGEIRLKGRFLPASDPYEFMKPIHDAIRDYIKTPQETTTIDVFYEYINSGSLKYFMEIFKLLKFIELDGHQINCRWHIEDADDDDSVQMSKDVAKYSGLNLQLINDSKA